MKLEIVESSVFGSAIFIYPVTVHFSREWPPLVQLAPCDLEAFCSITQHIPDTVRAATEQLVPSLNLRMRLSPPTAATMRARRMINTMTCTELPVAALGQQSQSKDALSLANEAGAILPSKCCGGLTKQNICLNAQD